MPTIKDMRKIRCLTQTDLAHACGVSLNTVWMWESGYRNPGAKNRQKLYDVLGTTDLEGLGETGKDDE
jgi:transcriptional regulator with XRE-family HTH domain